MGIIRLIVVLVSICLFNGCTRKLTGRMNSGGGSQSAIHNSIIDFTNTSRLYKKDSVFHLSAYSTFTKVNLEEGKDGTFRSVPGEVIEDVMVVSIIANYNKFVERELGESAQERAKMPTQYYKVDGKLFYWWDLSLPLTAEAISTFRSFDLLLPNNLNGLIEAAESGEYVSPKAVHYFFCKNDLKKYKRVLSKVAIGFYDLPKRVSCH